MYIVYKTKLLDLLLIFKGELSLMSAARNILKQRQKSLLELKKKEYEQTLKTQSWTSAEQTWKHLGAITLNRCNVGLFD